jgi:hypothetical protein
MHDARRFSLPDPMILIAATATARACLRSPLEHRMTLIGDGRLIYNVRPCPCRDDAARARRGPARLRDTDPGQSPVEPPQGQRALSRHRNHGPFPTPRPCRPGSSSTKPAAVVTWSFSPVGDRILLPLWNPPCVDLVRVLAGGSRSPDRSSPERRREGSASRAARNGGPPGQP